MSYVNITRDELEAWLTAENFDWERVDGRVGIYHICLSDNVAILLSSTQTRDDESMGHGNAGMNLRLVSRLNGWTLNRKARDRKHFKRTKNWRDTWSKGVHHWMGEYSSKTSFYEKIADREAYKFKWCGIISGSSSYPSSRFLREAYEKVSGGKILWDNEETKILALG